jgi:hypothetical protein
MSSEVGRLLKGNPEIPQFRFALLGMTRDKFGALRPAGLAQRGGSSYFCDPCSAA